MAFEKRIEPIGSVSLTRVGPGPGSELYRIDRFDQVAHKGDSTTELPPDALQADRPAARHGAGTDPEKCARILAGAREVFMPKGFDATGVNDICRAASVSKSTLYVYFENKEDLFERTIEVERDRVFEGISGIL